MSLEELHFAGECHVHKLDRYLSTLAVAEQLYDALYQFDRLGRLDVDMTSLLFYRDLDPSIQTGSYALSSGVYANITSAIRRYADGYLSIVQKYTAPGGGLAEQYSRDDGSPVSAADLTWCTSFFRPFWVHPDPL